MQPNTLHLLVSACSETGTSKEQAMQEYINLLEKDDPNWESHPALADYKA